MFAQSMEHQEQHFAPALLVCAEAALYPIIQQCSCCAVLMQKSALNTVMICAGAVADDRNLIASVTKRGEKKAIIEVKGATHYFAEGDLFDRNFKITKGTQVAQVM